jgi:membrane-associated phospholipid phosphatase
MINGGRMAPDSRNGVSRLIVKWAALFVIAALCMLAESHCSYFSGDVSIEKWVQALLQGDLSWAQTVSHSAEFPWLLIIWLIVFALSWAFAGWRAAVLSVFSLAGMLALGLWLGPLVGRPRPSPDLVHVMKQLPGYAFPSLFALRYAAMFGFLAIIAMMKGHGARRAIVLISCFALFILGWFARIALAAHWPSDVIVSYYLGLVWAALLINIGLNIPRPRRWG